MDDSFTTEELKLIYLTQLAQYSDEYRTWWNTKYGSVEPDCEYLARIFNILDKLDKLE